MLATISSEARAKAFLGPSWTRTQTAIRLPMILATVMALVDQVAAVTPWTPKSAVIVFDIIDPATQEKANRA